VVDHAVVLVFALAVVAIEWRTRAEREARRNQLRHLGLGIHLYLDDNKGHLPAYAPGRPELRFNSWFVQDYVRMERLKKSPDWLDADLRRRTAAEVQRNGYLYFRHSVCECLGFGLHGDEALPAVLLYYAEQIRQGQSLDEGMKESDCLYRVGDWTWTVHEDQIFLLQMWLYRGSMYDINDPKKGYLPGQSVPVVIERPDPAGKEDMYVLYFDGHVECKLPGEAPNTAEFRAALSAFEEAAADST